MDITAGEKLIIMGGFRGNGLMITKVKSMEQLMKKALEQMSVFERIINEDEEKGHG